jgi:Zn-dependent oligopeptidase
LASKKGIAITAVIAAAIVGSSFLIWVIPQSSPGSMIELPRDDNGIISDVYSQHQSLATNIELKFEHWKRGEMTPSDMLSQISRDLSDIQNMRQQLDSASPAQEWQQSYDFYIQALDSFLKYIDLMQTIIEENDGMLDSNFKLDTLKQEWQGYVNNSINAMPI